MGKFIVKPNWINSRHEKFDDFLRLNLLVMVMGIDQISGIRLDVCPDIQWYSYYVYGNIKVLTCWVKFGEFSFLTCFPTHVRHVFYDTIWLVLRDIWYPSGYLTRYPVFGRISNSVLFDADLFIGIQREFK